MESNFIRERVTVREELIKKNLKSDNDKKKVNIPLDNPPERVVALEELVNEKLRQDLVELSRRVDSICQLVADYIKVRSALKVFRTNPKDIRVLTNIGCNFYAQCHIDDASKIYLCVGKDYFLQLELDEAIKMIDFKEKQLIKLLDLYQEKASSIKAYIKIVLEAIDKIYKIEHP